MMTTNELKKGTKIKLNNGWFGTLIDSRKGNTRLAEVEGYVTEMGSIYSHDIVAAYVNDKWVTIKPTESQLKLKKNIANFW